MNKLIEEAKSKAGYKSNDALAKAMLRHSPELASSLQARSLGARIGKLAKGEIDWWRKNPVCLDALTELLHADPADIGIHDGVEDHFFSFAEFPELPPLDLRYEFPCDLAFGANVNQHLRHKVAVGAEDLDLEPWFLENHMLDRRNMPWGFSWLYVPNELGTDLLVKQLQARSTFEVLEVESFQDVRIHAHATKPIVISVSRQSEREDLALFANHPETAVLVISPFPMPLAGESGVFLIPIDWELASLPRAERDLRSLGSPYMWTLRDDWRSRLIAWVQQRLLSRKVDTLFEEAEVVSWIEVFDPEERLIRTPTDLLAVCRMFHGRPKIGRPDAAGRDVGHRLQSCLVPMDSRSSDTFNRLAEAVWHRMDLPWGEPLDWAQWRNLSAFQGDQRLKGDTANARNNVKALGAGMRPQQKAGGASTLLDDLKRIGLLQSVPRRATGDYALKPQLLADLRIRDLLVAGIQTADFQAWGRLSLDQGRQYLIDASLSSASMNDLLKTVRRVLAEDPWDATVLGASESLFLELGNRRAEGQSLAPEMQGIVEMVLSRYFDSGNDGPTLLFSRGAESRVDHPNVLRTITACMGWSLTNRPKDFRKLDAQVLQLFPGWSGKNATMPPIPDHPGKSSRSNQSSPPRWRRFLKAMHSSLAELTVWPSTPDEPKTDTLTPLMLVAKLCRGERAPSDWWEEVAQNQWATDFVLEQLNVHQSNDVATSAMGEMLTSVYEGFSRDKAKCRHAILFGSRLWRWAIEQSTPSTFIAQMDAIQIAVLRAFPEVLPMSWRRSLLEVLPLSTDGRNDSLIRTAGADAQTQLLKRLGTLEGTPAAERLWQLSAGNVLNTLESGQLDEKSMFDLLWNSPPHLAAQLVGYVEEHPTYSDKQKRRDWAIKRLQANAVHADQILSLLRRTVSVHSQ